MPSKARLNTPSNNTSAGSALLDAAQASPDTASISSQQTALAEQALREPAANAAATSAREALAASQKYASESRLKSWWHVASSFALVLGFLAAAVLLPWWPVRAMSGIVGGLVLVRCFILYHDYMHGSILKKSRIAKFIMHVFGMFALTPARSWRVSHNYHHAHVGDIAETHVGSFPVMTVEAWRNSPWGRRLMYRLARHPFVIVVGAYISVFAASVTIAPLLRNPLKHWDSALAILLHGGLAASLWILGGPLAALFGVFIPFFVSAALGSYLFYAQHNYEGMKVYHRADWDFHSAALESSSFLKMNPLMNWFTGSIGYHHVHHLNLSIPFYRLKEAMHAIPTLQHPVTTTLSPREIARCLSLKLWDERQGRMVSFRQAKRQVSTIK